jgi:hypothetical protein|tara:strand:- start:196 stop:1197 length:1002 start_codon:yes stop_codon:yes gene_type:complete
MSKYNLVDIFEDYKIGSGWTNDFDYDGMLNAGLALNAETDIETLKKVVEDFTDVNYHREASHLYDVIEAIEGGDAFEASGRIDDFHAEIRKTMQDQGMDTSDDLGAYMASKMEEGEAVDLAIEASQEKAGIKEDEEVDEIAGYDRKGNKQEDSDGSDASKYKRAAMNIKEEEGFIEVSQDEIKMHLDQFKSGNIDGDDLVQAIEEIVFGRDSMEESFDSLAKKLDKQKGIDKDEAAKIAGSIAAKKAAGAGKGPTAKQKKRMSEGMLKDVVLAIIKDTNATNPEVQMYIDSLTQDIKLNGKESYSDYEIDDYIEDFKNYVADKSLQEHFKRFK